MSIASQDATWAREVKERDGFTCQYCGVARREQTLEAAHIFTRSIKVTRHLLANGVTLCLRHHLWAHDKPQEFLQWVEKWMGAEAFAELRALARTTGKRVPRRVGA